MAPQNIDNDSISKHIENMFRVLTGDEYIVPVCTAADITFAAHGAPREIEMYSRT